MNIIARKPRDHEGNEFIVVKRHGVTAMPFVVATANQYSLALDEWFWGHYFLTEEEAMDYFNHRCPTI